MSVISPKTSGESGESEVTYQGAGPASTQSSSRTNEETSADTAT
jgi:hypothetical protein